MWNIGMRVWGRSVAVMVAGALLPALCVAQAAPVRPKITGISHIGYYVSDLPKALEFWHGLLGYDVYFTTQKPDSAETRIAFVKINDHQHVELFNEPPTHPPNMMSHICFTTDDAERMRKYLQASGIGVPPGVTKTRTGDLAFEVTDPDGAKVEFMQMLPGDVEAKSGGRFDPETRISTKIYHAGFIVGNSQASMDFYGKVLGFTQTWQGGANPAELSWMNMKVPDGDDYVEFMLYRTYDPKRLGTMNHLSLAVPDLDKAVAALKARPAFANYGRPLEVHLGVNRKRQVNLFDPDGTRVELMEPFTIDGKVTPWSTAPPPPASPHP
jgi:lactoylglutathione lyase